MKLSHVHLFGSLTRRPARGDLCIICAEPWRPGIACYIDPTRRPLLRRWWGSWPEQTEQVPTC